MSIAIELPQRRPWSLSGHGRWLRHLWTAPVYIALAITTLYPTVLLIALALSNSRLGRPFAGWTGLKNFTVALQDPNFLASIARSTVFAIISSGLELALGLAIALLFVSLVRTGRFLTSLILLPLMTPPMMVGVAWKLILSPGGGLVNGILLKLGLIAEPISFLGTFGLAWLSVGLADAWQWIPFIAILCFAALQSLPGEVHEAAMLDSDSAWERFRHVTLPLIAPALTSIFLLKLIIAFKIFDLIFILTFGGPGFETTTGGFLIWRHALQQFDVGRAAAETIIFSLVIGLMTIPVVRLHQRAERATA